MKITKSMAKEMMKKIKMLVILRLHPLLKIIRERVKKQQIIGTPPKQYKCSSR